MKALSRLESAIVLAIRHHASVRDKAGFLYILHPLRVMQNKLLKTEDEQIAAVLHDTIEDTDLTAQEIASEFGWEIANWVSMLSRVEGQTYEDFIRACSQHDVTRRIKLADLEDNQNRPELPNREIWVRNLGRYARATAFLKYGNSWFGLEGY